MMNLRDETESLLRSWDAYERDREAPAIIDFDCHPTNEPVKPAAGRLPVLREFARLRTDADPELATRIESHIAYLRALMGERWPLDQYMRATLGCGTSGWSSEYLAAVEDTIRTRIDDLGIAWGPSTVQDLIQAEGPIDTDAAPDAIRQAVAEAEPIVRRLVDSDAPFHLSVETTDIQAYWAYWLDGSGHDIRLRLNLRNATFTKVTARQFALHEVLGHGLKGASYSARCAVEDIPWIRLLSVHSSHQVLLEGLAQALPLFATPDDEAVLTRVALDHFTYLVRAELHLAINSGKSVEECAAFAQKRVPWWKADSIGDALTDRSTDPLLRSYLWAYPAGQDWFTHLSRTEPAIWQPVLRAAYRKPLSTTELTNLWPAGPAIGGA